MAKGKTYLAHAVGRRKSSIARVYVAEGTGKVLVNNRELSNYFPKATSRYMVQQPFNLLGVGEKFDVNINVKGGGITGQAGAIRLGLARILSTLNPAHKPELRKAGFLTRDSRKVERKKPEMD